MGAMDLIWKDTFSSRSEKR